MTTTKILTKEAKSSMKNQELQKALSFLTKFKIETDADRFKVSVKTYWQTLYCGKTIVDDHEPYVVLGFVPNKRNRKVVVYPSRSIKIEAISFAPEVTEMLVKDVALGQFYIRIYADVNVAPNLDPPESFKEIVVLKKNDDLL